MTIQVKAHHRRILDLASENNPTNARVDAYNKAIGYQESHAQGWIEERPKPAGNGYYFCITPSGEDALRQPKLKPTLKHRSVATAKSRISLLPDRLSTPKKR